jgi:hydrogenase-4 component A
MCALACPFGAIIPGGTPAPKFDFNVGQYTYVNTPYQADPMYLREFALQERLSLLNWSIGQKTVAVKCDLCYFREEGPACIAACPHKALRLVDDGTGLPMKFVEQTKTVAVLEEEAA